MKTKKRRKQRSLGQSKVAFMMARAQRPTLFAPYFPPSPESEHHLFHAFYGWTKGAQAPQKEFHAGLHLLRAAELMTCGVEVVVKLRQGVFHVFPIL